MDPVLEYLFDIALFTLVCIFLAAALGAVAAWWGSR